MLGGHFSAPIDTGSGPVLGLAVCTAFRVGERMSCDESKNIAHICRYPPHIFMYCRYFAKRQGFYTKNLKFLT